MFRSTLTTAISGISAGLAVVVTQPVPDKVEAALAALISALAIAIADYFARAKTRREHEQNVHHEHEITRAVILKARRPSRRKTSKSKTL
jgi:membrane protein implicated in regulation of membrane protease activity